MEFTPTYVKAPLMNVEVKLSRFEAVELRDFLRAARSDITRAYSCMPSTYELETLITNALAGENK
jgi:hypothetical protein